MHFIKNQFFFRAHNICERYPNYVCSISGIGEVPKDGDENLGKCSQMVCFVRKDMLHILQNSDDASKDLSSICLDQTDSEVVFPLEKFNYELLYSKPFPFDQETRTTDERILDDVKYFINRHLYVDDPFFDEDKNTFEFPVESIFHFVHDATDTNELRTIIRKEFVINENDCVVHDLPQSSDSEPSSSEDEADTKDTQQITYADVEEENWE